MTRTYGVKMPVNAPILITRAHIGKGPGILLISLAAPAGELGTGSVTNVEVIRVAMTHSTFREIADLFNSTIAGLDLGNGGTALPAAEQERKRYARERRPRAFSEKN
jgi:hypothetical protein